MIAIQDAVAEIANIRDAGAKLALATIHEQRLHSQRGIQKASAIARIIGTENPETTKPHSATSAEKVVESDGVYASFLEDCRQSVVDRIRAEAEYDCAKLSAQLAVKLAEPAPSSGT